MKSIILFVLASVFLMSCGNFSDGTSVWQSGLWIVPWLTGVGAAIFFALAYKSSKSGSNKILPNGGISKEEGGNVPLTQLGFFWFSVALAVATIVIVIMVNSDK